jgi:hypothetical protein
MKRSRGCSPDTGMNNTKQCIYTEKSVDMHVKILYVLFPDNKSEVEEEVDVSCFYFQLKLQLLQI